jgi:hypothetical protein
LGLCRTGFELVAFLLALVKVFFDLVQLVEVVCILALEQQDEPSQDSPA